MALRIKLKNSVVQDRVPTTSDLPEVGELAVNANINSIGGFMRASDNSVVKIFGPGSLSTPTATTSVPGISELATNSETTTGTATNRVVTPAGLNAVTVAERTTSNSTYLALAGGTLTGVLAATAGSNSAPSIHFGDSDSGIFGGTNTVSLAAGGTTGLSVFETNVRVPTKLGINGAVPQTPLDVIANASGYAMAVRGRSADDLAQIRFTSNNYGTIFAELESDATYLATRIGGSEALRVNSSGHLLVGTSSARSNFFNLGSTHTPRLQVESTSNDNGRAALGLIYGIANASGPYIVMAKHRSASIGGNTVAQNNDETGIISFQGSDGSQFVDTARIESFVDGTPGANDMPGRLVFSTTADGAVSPTARMSIKADGKIGIGTTSPSTLLHLNKTSGDCDLQVQATGTNTDARLNLYGHSGGVSQIRFGDQDDTNVGLLTYDHSTNSMQFRTADAERMRIDSSGRLLLGVTSASHASANADDLCIGSNTSSTERGLTFGSTLAATIRWADAEQSGAGIIEYVHTDNRMTFTTNNAERMRIDSSGKLLVGANSTSATHTLQVQADANANAIAILGRSSDDIGELAFYQNDASSKLGEIQYRVSELSIRHREGGANILFSNTPVGGSLTERMRIKHDGNVGIGTSSPDQTLHVHKGSAGSISSNSSSVLTLENNSDVVLQFLTPATSAAQLRFGDPSDNGAGFIQYLHANNALQFGTNGPEKMRLDANGRLGIGTSSPSHKLHTVIEAGESNGVAFLNANSQGLNIYTDTTANNADVFIDQGIANSSLFFAQAGTKRVSIGSDTTQRIYQNTTFKTVLNTNHAAAGSSNAQGSFIRAHANCSSITDDDTVKFVVFITGDVQNVNNSYNAISDINLKQDIVDADSQWDDIKNLKVRKYRFKNNPTGPLQIGCIAQEAETVSPGLVDIDPEQGFKSFKYSVLYMKAIKCLQEAMAKIETLETKVAALEAA